MALAAARRAVLGLSRITNLECCPQIRSTRTVPMPHLATPQLLRRLTSGVTATEQDKGMPRLVPMLNGEKVAYLINCDFNSDFNINCDFNRPYLRSVLCLPTLDGKSLDDLYPATCGERP